MPISFACPACGKKLKAPDGKAGVKTACPQCRKPLIVPSPIIAASPPISSAAIKAKAPKAEEILEAEEYTPPASDSRKGKRGGKLIIVGIGVILLVVLLVAFIVKSLLVLGSNNPVVQPSSPTAKEEGSWKLEKTFAKQNEVWKAEKDKLVLGKSRASVRSMMGEPYRIDTPNSVDTIKLGVEIWCYLAPEPKIDHPYAGTWRITFTYGVCSSTEVTYITANP